MMNQLTVSVFPGGFNWPLFVAIETQLFTQHNLQITIQPTANSVSQMTDFAAQKFQIAMTAFDNIVAYVSGDGEAPIGPQPQFFAFLGSDDSFLSLVADPATTTIEQLRGKAVSVDAATTGYAFLLFDMLRRAGLEPGSYQVDRVGGMIQRWHDLRDGGHAATMLSSPYDLVAQQAGCHVLARAPGPYQGNVAAARRDWAADHPDQVIGFIRAYVGAVKWLQRPENRAAAIAILCRHVDGMTEDLAAASADVLPAGFFCDGRLSSEGIETVLALRQRHLTDSRAMAEANLYMDLSYWRATFPV